MIHRKEKYKKLFNKSSQLRSCRGRCLSTRKKIRSKDDRRVRIWDRREEKILKFGGGFGRSTGRGWLWRETSTELTGLLFPRERDEKHSSPESQNNFLNFNLQSIKVECLFYLLARIFVSGWKVDVPASKRSPPRFANKNTSYPRLVLAFRVRPAKTSGSTPTGQNCFFPHSDISGNISKISNIQISLWLSSTLSWPIIDYLDLNAVNIIYNRQEKGLWRSKRRLIFYCTRI